MLRRLIVMLVLLVIFAGVCLFALYRLDYKDVSSCSDNAECVLVYANICKDTRAINNGYLWLWQKHMALVQQITTPVLCEKAVPMDTLVARCVAAHCSAIPK